MNPLYAIVDVLERCRQFGYIVHTFNQSGLLIMLTILIAALAAVTAVTSTTIAQQVQCDIRVNYESIPSTNKDLLTNFAADVRDYINNYSWGSDVLDEPIKCTMEIFIQNVVGENRYSAQVFVGSSRPIYSSNQSSAVLRLKDEAWEFTYIRARPINHNLYTFNDLASFLDFYVYLIIGFDYDTYDNLNGTPHFQKAADIASLGRSAGARGWQPSTSGFSRIQLIEEILNARFAPVRTASFLYHFAGLDSLSSAPDRAYRNMIEAIRMIGDVKKTADARNQIIRVFFDTKYMELAQLFVNYRDPKVYYDLATIDPTHQTTYEEYRKKQK
ncbi:MAG: hypothetical protein C4326_06085 [Ignavibacteria bacterium]